MEKDQRKNRKGKGKGSVFFCFERERINKTMRSLTSAVRETHHPETVDILKGGRKVRVRKESVLKKGGGGVEIKAYYPHKEICKDYYLRVRSLCVESCKGRDYTLQRRMQFTRRGERRGIIWGGEEEHKKS